MGCVSSKKARSESPLPYFTASRSRRHSKRLVISSVPVHVEEDFRHANRQVIPPVPVHVEEDFRHANRQVIPPVPVHVEEDIGHGKRQVISSVPVHVEEVFGHANHQVVSPVHVNVEEDFGPLEEIKEEPDKEVEVVEEGEQEKDESEDESIERRRGFDDRYGESRPINKGPTDMRVDCSIKYGRLVEAEHVAAGWPVWLSAVAGEAIEGWLPLRSDTFQRLDKIGQGTYSDVYRARDMETGKMVALKKIKFDNFHPESVRFMAREILILRKLDHPNIMKLEGIITSRLSCSLYLVFEYMEHDLAGLLSCPDIRFTESQIKCYMRQLLSGLEYCHRHGIMHRDIKTSNILINNEGVLKIGDFGLANFMRPKDKQPLTSRVVTLWYRPPELLMGSTNYGETVDLWSVGCVFAEFFLGRPFFKGRTEVEQLHKIFKMCGSPPEEYWKRCRLPLATMFKPQNPYESELYERCKEFPESAVGLIETFLSVEPYKRGTATSALDAEYFHTKPYACEISSLPMFPPNKEIDAKYREDLKRKKSVAAGRAQSGSRNTSLVRKITQESNDSFKGIPREEMERNVQIAQRKRGVSTNVHKRRGGAESRTTSNQQLDTMSDVSQITEAESNVSSIHSLPAYNTQSTTGTSLPKRKKHPDVFTRLHDNHATRRRRAATLGSSDMPNVLDSDVYTNDGIENGEQMHLPHELAEDDVNKKKRGKVRLDTSRQSGQPQQALNRSRFN